VTDLPVRPWDRLPRWMTAVGDQALVALVNLLLSVAVTQVAGVSALGRFAVVTATILLCLGFARLLVTDPWLASRTAPRSAVQELRWLVLLTAAGTTAVVTVAVLISCGGDARWYLACAIAPVIIVQDFGRYVAFRVETPHRAFASDAGVLAAAVVAFGLLWIAGSAGLTAVLLSWLIGLGFGTVISARTIFGSISSKGSRQWWARFCRPLATKLAVDSIAYMVGVSGSLYLLAYLGTQRDVGMVRIVQTVFSPAALTVTGLTMWLVPMLANRDPAHAAVVRRRVTTWLVAGSVPLVVAAVVVGPWFVRLVFGTSETPDALALCLAGVSTTAIAVAAPWVAGARVSGHYSPIAWTRVASAVITCLGMAVLVGLRGTTGYLGLLALQNVMIAATAIIIGSRRDAGLRPVRTEGSGRATRRLAGRRLE
jgi:O-antigen/teichoic acid export membrane protein